MDIPVWTFLLLVAVLSCGCGVGLGFAIGVNVGLWHERRRVQETPPRPLLVSIHEHFNGDDFGFPGGVICDSDDDEFGGFHDTDDDDTSSGGERWRNN